MKCAYKVYILIGSAAQHHVLVTYCKKRRDVKIVQKRREKSYNSKTRIKDSEHEFHETCHSVTFYFMKKDSKRWCDTTMPESIHTKDESKRGSAFAFIFGVN